MKKLKLLLILGAFTLTATPMVGNSRIKLTSQTLMHEMRATVYPQNGAQLADRYVSLQWPLHEDHNSVGAGLDGVEEEKSKKLDPLGRNYQVRLSQDIHFNQNVISAYTSWPFYNPENNIRSGRWFWQYGYVNSDGTTEWSETNSFDVVPNALKFAPPTYRNFMTNLPSTHPRILVFEKDWNQVIESSKDKIEREWYLHESAKIMKTPIVDFHNSINTDLLKGLDSEFKKNSMLTRESRRFVDKEEGNLEVLIRTYILTKDKKYAEIAIDRLKSMITWKKSPYMKGDFNQATYLLLASTAYDSFYNILDEETKKLLLTEIKENGTKIFNHFVNHLANHIADNHNWQMNLRIFTFAAFAVYGDLEEADKWTEYSYEIWRARFPGLNEDGGWHNGDSYFQVNARTLIEVPYFYSRVSGYDFFSDPWYAGNALYVMYQQPPFSKSGGNGSGHQKVYKPNSIRVSYADALARLLNHPFLAQYSEMIIEKEPNILKKAFMAKPGDLAWFRIVCNKPLPKPITLGHLPVGCVFPQTGLASFLSNWGDLHRNAMVSFRSSPYGSTSHALANQNAFNTFFDGRPLFYSSGHHISFIDEHGVYCHRASRAHNTILVNGMGQKIGTEGYGWIPRHYVGKEISYVLGDASNAYGEVISKLWQNRAKEAKIDFSPKNGWDKNHLETFRRHIVTLGDASITFIYDELEADEPVTWDYLLHTVKEPMQQSESNKILTIKATNGKAESDAYLFSSGKVKTNMTDQFFTPAINWLRADAKGNFESYANHWHFTATSEKSKNYRFATVLVTHHRDAHKIEVKQNKKGIITVGDWVIKANLDVNSKAYFEIKNRVTNSKIVLDDSTSIYDMMGNTILEDKFPSLEI